MARNYQGVRCFYCGDPATSRDHARPRSRKGTCHKDNLLPACQTCNTVKGDFTLEEFRTTLTGWLANLDFRPKQWRTIQKLKPFRVNNRFFFYGERGTVNGVFPPVAESKPFRHAWKMRTPRNAGKKAIAIEECAKRGPFKKVQGGLVKGK